MLRACGLPATLAVGLDDLPLGCVDRFCESFILSGYRKFHARSLEPVPAACGSPVADRPDDPTRRTFRSLPQDSHAGADLTATCAASSAAHVSEEPMQAALVLLGWTPLELSEAAPDPLPAIVNHLQELQRFLRVGLYKIDLWEVDEESLGRLRFIAARRNSTLFTEALLEEAADYKNNIVHYGQEKPVAPGPPQDYPTALARLCESASSHSGVGGASRDRKLRSAGEVRAAIVNRELAILQKASPSLRELKVRVKIANQMLRDAKSSIEP